MLSLLRSAPPTASKLVPTQNLVAAYTIQCRTAPSVMESLRALTDLLISMYRERLSNISTADTLLGAQCASNRIETRSDSNSRCRQHNPMPYGAHSPWNLCARSLTFLIACIESAYRISARPILFLVRSAPPTASKLVPTRFSLPPTHPMPYGDHSSWNLQARFLILSLLS